MDLKPIEKLRPFRRFCMTIGELPSSYLESMTYLELLYWFIDFLQTQVIPTVNNNAQAVEELQTLFVQLQNYVDEYQAALSKDFSDLKNWTEDYLENLDVQQEINNKLDDMVESGELDEIFSHWIHKLNWFYITPETTQTELQADLDTVGTKVVEFQKGEYNYDYTLHLNANTTLILNESTLNFSVTHGFFNFYNGDTPTKYNGNGNIKIINGTIKGGDISLCHANNVLLQNINFVDILNDHVLEIASCQNYIVDNCYFEGIAIQPDSRNYVECIQIDDMTRSNFPWFLTGNDIPYDETPNNLITIKNCTFKQDPTKTDSFHIYTCIGGHTNVSNRNDNITIDNCIFADWTYSAIRHYSWKNVTIKNCSFFNNSDTSTEILENHVNYALRDILSINEYLDNLIFENNYSLGNNRIYVSDNIKNINNIKILNNTFENINWYLVKNNDDNITTNTDARLIYAFRLNEISESLEISNNKFVNCEKYIARFGGYKKTKYVKIDNNDYYGQYTAGFLHLYCNASTYIITNNNFNSSSPFNNSWGQINKQNIRFNSTYKNNVYYKNNVLPVLTGVASLDVQPDENSDFNFSSVFNLRFRLASPNATSGENIPLVFNRRFSDFNAILLDLGNQSITGLQLIQLPSIKFPSKLEPHLYTFKTNIGGNTDDVTIQFTINNDNTFSFTCSNYRIKDVFGINL